jgi:hypothetical protein
MPDFNTHVAILQLVIGYTLVGAFVFTVIITCLSLVGVVRFADAAQGRKLFAILIVELVVICVAVFSDLIRLSPKQVVAEVTAPIVNELESAREAEARTATSLAELADASEALRASVASATEGLESAAVPGLAPADTLRIRQQSEALGEVLARVRTTVPPPQGGGGGG